MSDLVFSYAQSRDWNNENSNLEALSATKITRDKVWGLFIIEEMIGAFERALRTN